MRTYLLFEVLEFFLKLEFLQFFPVVLLSLITEGQRYRDIQSYYQKREQDTEQQRKRENKMRPPLRNDVSWQLIKGFGGRTAGSSG